MVLNLGNDQQIDNNIKEELMKKITSFILVITILCLNSCYKQPSNSYGSPKNTFVEDFTKALEESNKVVNNTVSEMGRFKLYDVLPDSTKIYQNLNLYIVVSTTGDVAAVHR